MAFQARLFVGASLMAKETLVIDRWWSGVSKREGNGGSGGWRIGRDVPVGKEIWGKREE